MSSSRNSSPGGNAVFVFFIVFAGIYGLILIAGGILSAANPTTPLEDAQADCTYQGLVYDEATGECR